MSKFPPDQSQDNLEQSAEDNPQKSAKVVSVPPEIKKRSLFNRILRGLGLTFAGLVGLLVVAGLGFWAFAMSRINKSYDITPASITIPTDAASIERGKILSEVVRCTECHGADLSGTTWVNRPIRRGHFGPSNLTRGLNGLPDDYSDADFMRAIRHAVGKDGKPLILMPSNFFTKLNEADLGALIAYIKSLPPTDGDSPPNTTGPELWYGVLNEAQGLPVRLIDHANLPPPVKMQPTLSLEYGEYTADSCKSCHGADLAGDPFLERLGTAAPNLTPITLGDWTEDDFLTAMHTGKTPSGYVINPELMPREAIGKLSEVELKALWLYMQSIPAVATEDSIEMQKELLWQEQHQ